MPASSSRIGTLRSVAFVSFATPGSAPTTTAKVLFDTDPGDLPPRSRIAASALSAGEASERAKVTDHRFSGRASGVTPPVTIGTAGTEARRSSPRPIAGPR